MNLKRDITMNLPINQLKLYGYGNYFNFFCKLFNKNKLPNTILFTGLKGLGKSTFAYHFINYLFSLNESNNYSTDNLLINSDNKSYKLLTANLHPNFFMLEGGKNNESIKIDDVRNLLSFLNKSTYNYNKKIVLIDNAESLNLSSSNSLLKSLEEPPENTFFFIINDSSSKILNTIKSRSIEFKFYFSFQDKKEILKKIILDYEIAFNMNDIEDLIFFDSPGNILKFLLIMNEANIESVQNKRLVISYLICADGNGMINFPPFFINCALDKKNFL